MQLVMCMIEQGDIESGLILDDPLRALLAWDHDPTLQATAPLISGKQFRAVDMQAAFCAKARAFVDAGRAEGLVPEAARILALWEDTLDALRGGDTERLLPRLEWVLKRHTLMQAMEQHGLDWGDPRVKYLDHMFGNLDPREGLFWSYQRSGLVDRIVTDAQIERCRHLPPEDTRDWLRGTVLGHPEAADVLEAVDWDRLRYRARREGDSWTRPHLLRLDHPARFTRADCESILAGAPTLVDALETLRERQEGTAATPTADVNTAQPAEAAAER
jgi:proteasome accessory factor A